MAGKQQHFIPQHYQEPFVIPGGGDRLWMFRKGHPCGIKVARKNSATQRYFYSKPSQDGSPTLDDLVTDYEYSLHAIVDQIREVQVGEEIDSLKIAKVVTHLSVRSSHMRGVLRESVSAVTSAIQAAVHGELGSTLTELPRNQPPRKIYQMISEELKKLGILKFTQITEETIINLLYFMLRENSRVILSEVLPQFTGILEALNAGVEKTIRNAHTSALLKAMAPEAWITRLSQLVWHVVPAPSDGAILPDCTSIGFDGDEWKPLLFIGASKLNVVALPLAPDRLAIGRTEKNQNVDISQFNRHAVQASYSFFLSSYTSEELEKFSQDYWRRGAGHPFQA